MHLIVFDVDGTLVESAAFDGQLYAQAVKEVLGFNIDTDWTKYTNVTDSILREVLATQAFSGDRQATPAYLCRGGRLSEATGRMLQCI